VWTRRPRRASRPGTVGFQHAKSEQGSSLVEFALIFLVMMVMILGIIDFCRAAYSYHFVSEAAREATRWAAVNGATCGPPPAGDNSCNGTSPMNNGPASQTDIQNYVTNMTPPGIDSTKITTTVTWPVQANSPAICSKTVTGIGAATPNYPGCTVEVQVSYSFSLIFPLVYKAFSPNGTITLSSTSEMVIIH
jgi:Flp pilus assembly protein TadG